MCSSEVRHERGRLCLDDGASCAPSARRCPKSEGRAPGYVLLFCSTARAISMSCCVLLCGCIASLVCGSNSAGNADTGRLIEDALRHVE